MARTKKKFSYNAPVVLTFVLLCFVVTLLGLFTNHQSTRLCFSVYRAPLSDPLTYIRFVGHALGHTNLEHFIGNAMLLLVIGPLLEEKYGSKAMLKVMLAVAIFTGVSHFLLWHNVALCGASGIVFAFIILSSFVAFKTGEVPITAIIVAILYIGKEVYSGVFVQDDVSNLTHILGGIVGGAAGYKLNKK